MKKKKTKAEEAELLAALREGKVGFEDDPAEEETLNAAFERGEFKPISPARKKQLMEAAAETLARPKKEKKPPLSYKGYSGRYRYDPESRVFRGEVVDIKDVITFQADTEKDIEKAFRESIDDYLSFCARNGQEPNKPNKRARHSLAAFFREQKKDPVTKAFNDIAHEKWPKG
ncbi:MAG TPA: type II toxin-antitoxin system HicB family antitoxin [bacterium]|nr:type II toxin-antitoxin system HicB family antitoxin [bacterium]